MPLHAIAYCLEEVGCTLDDLDFVVFYEKPLLKFERLFETYLAGAPRGFRSFAKAIPIWMQEKLFYRRQFKTALENLASTKFDWDRRLLFSEHHLSHAASAFFPAPFQEALILTLDGVGEWTTSSIALGRGNAIDILREIHFPHSLGLLYTAFTEYLGFKVNSGEYKVMGLAPYGKPVYSELILDRLIDVKSDGSFWLDQSYFDYCWGLRMTSPKFHALFGGRPRKPDEALEKRHMDLAASIQQVLDRVVVKIVRSFVAETGCRNLCMAGGVALNCVSNSAVLRSGCIDSIWIQPAPGDAGGALGAALAAYHMHLESSRSICGCRDQMRGGYLGPAFDQCDIETRLQAMGAVFSSLSENELLRACAEELEAGRALGWFQGRMEFGPRALGARSILADPRTAEMQATLNLKIKYRESFRPFAPSVLCERASDWFDLGIDSPYMLFVGQAIRSEIPAVTHVDGSARIQTVHRDTNRLYYRLLETFHARTGCPVLLNTSFNVRGEPIVCTPEDAFRCFMGTGLDALAIGNCFLRKVQQQAQTEPGYRHAIDPD
jgi:carbamoyltransferase